MKPESSAPALDGGLELLEFVVRAGRPVPFSELLGTSSLSKASVIRLLKILLQRGYLSREEQTGYYLAGVQLAVLGRQTPLFSLLARHTDPLLAEASAALGHTVICFWRDEDYMQSVAKAMHPASIAMQEIGGRSRDFNATPWSTILLAELAREMGCSCQTILEKAPPSNFPPMVEWLEQYASHGFILDDVRRHPGIRRVAVPLWNRNRLCGALAAGCTVAALAVEEAPALARHLRSFADRLTTLWFSSQD